MSDELPADSTLFPENLSQQKSSLARKNTADCGLGRFQSGGHAYLSWPVDLRRNVETAIGYRSHRIS